MAVLVKHLDLDVSCGAEARLRLLCGAAPGLCTGIGASDTQIHFLRAQQGVAGRWGDCIQVGILLG